MMKLPAKNLLLVLCFGCLLFDHVLHGDVVEPKEYQEQDLQQIPDNGGNTAKSRMFNNANLKHDIASSSEQQMLRQAMQLPYKSQEQQKALLSLLQMDPNNREIRLLLAALWIESEDLMLKEKAMQFIAEIIKNPSNTPQTGRDDSRQYSHQQQDAGGANSEKKLLQEAMQMPYGSPQQQQALLLLLQTFPKSTEARLVLASFWIGLDDPKRRNAALQFIVEANDPEKVSRSGLDLFQDPVFGKGAMHLTAVLGRDFAKQTHWSKARKYLQIAYNASKIWEPPEGNLCIQLMLATNWNVWPKTVADADKSLQEINQWSQALLNSRSTSRELDEDAMSDQMPGFANDPWTCCFQGVFFLSFYYRAETAKIAKQSFDMAATVWPTLLWTAPHVEQQYKNDNTALMATNTNCRKIKLGIVSAVLTEGHPVSEDFGGVLARLDRNLFDVTYVLLQEQIGPVIDAEFLFHNSQDAIFRFAKQESDIRRGDWILRIGREIAKLELDMILFLDLTMSSFCRRLGMMRLAPVQLNSHGHPVTSGHPREIVRYYVSWAEAELDLPIAQSFYTEELVMIPRGKIHQYYTPRVLPGSISRHDRQAFGHLTRADFGLPLNATIYLNMQKPFKLHPEFDPLVCGILDGDLEGYAVLHRADTVWASASDKQNHLIFVNRLKRAGCDLDRIIFLPPQPHHRLMALITLSTVILDSYPAGGCTTTREVLEVGKPVVTLPAHLLGARWTLGLYNILGLSDLPVIAATPEEYIGLAVALGTNGTLRSTVETRITEAVPAMFYREEAVEEWQKFLLRVSPVEPCQDRHSHGEL